MLFCYIKVNISSYKKVTNFDCKEYTRTKIPLVLINLATYIVWVMVNIDLSDEVGQFKHLSRHRNHFA